MGEDPYLAARIAEGYVNRVQSNGVAVCSEELCSEAIAVAKEADGAFRRRIE